MRPFPLAIALWLKACCVVAAVVLALYPLVPPEWVTAIDPVTRAPYELPRAHFTRVPFVLTWGLEGLRAVPAWLRAAAATVVVLAAAVPPGLRAPAWWVRARNVLPWSTGAVATMAFGAGVLLSALLRVPYGVAVTFGDGPRVVGDIENQVRLGSEAFTLLCFEAARKLAARAGSPAPALHGVYLLDAICGGTMAASAVVLARAVCGAPVLVLTVAAGLTCTGASLQFLGYLETTQIATACVAFFLAASAVATTTTGREDVTVAVVTALGAASTAFAAHGGCGLLLPACIVLLWKTTPARRPGPRGWLGRAFTGRNVLLLMGVLVLPALASTVLPYWVPDRWGNAAGGGDGIAWVPAEVDPAARPSRFVHYARFSRWHLAELLSSVAAVAPLLPVLAPSLVPRVACSRWRRGRDAGVRPAAKATLTVVGVAAVFMAAIPLLWNHDFGMWGDWNLAACYLWPAHALGWVALGAVARETARGPGFYLGVALPLLGVQMLATAGLGGQLFAALR